jgi:hypothetical protein
MIVAALAAWALGVALAGVVPWRWIFGEPPPGIFGAIKDWASAAAVIAATLAYLGLRRQIANQQEELTAVRRNLAIAEADVLIAKRDRLAERHAAIAERAAALVMIKTPAKFLMQTPHGAIGTNKQAFELATSVLNALNDYMVLDRKDPTTLVNRQDYRGTMASAYDDIDVLTRMTPETQGAHVKRRAAQLVDKVDALIGMMIDERNRIGRKLAELETALGE